VRKLIAAVNITIDGVVDNTAGLPDEELHQHYIDLLYSADVMLYGRKTYELMQYWQTVLTHPTGIREQDDFAHAIDRIRKVVFSRHLKQTGWETATLATEPPEVLAVDLKQQSGRDILIGSPGLIIRFLQLHLIDELQLCVHPVIAGSGRLLFEDLKDRHLFRLIKTKALHSGAVILYYQSTGNDEGTR